MLDLLRDVEAKEKQLAGVRARMEQALADTGRQKARVAMLVQRKLESDAKAKAKAQKRAAKESALA